MFFARTYLFYSGVRIVFLHLVTHTPTLQGFCSDAHRFTLIGWRLVGDVGVGGTNQPTHHPTHPAAYLPTNSPNYPYPPGHHARFLRRRASLIMKAIPRLLLEHSKHGRIADAAA